MLDVPQEQVGRWDHFFDRGGTSLSAVKLAIALDRKVSLADLTQHPVLADLAAFIDGRSERRPGLLHALSEPNGVARRALICFPYAAGNAVVFRPMAAALRDSGLDVYAVELPGHDLTVEPEPLASMERVVEQVVSEITARDLNGVLLWGHSAGAAFAAATARALQERNVPVERLFVGAELLGNSVERYAAIRELNGRSAAAIATALTEDDGYTALGELDARRATHVGAAFRHDWLSAHHYLAAALGEHMEIDVLGEELPVPVPVR